MSRSEFLMKKFNMILDSGNEEWKKSALVPLTKRTRAMCRVEVTNEQHNEDLRNRSNM